MIFEDDFEEQAPGAFRLSMYWDVYLPITIATFPAAIFMLMGILMEGLDKPGVEVPTLLIVAICVLEVVGIMAMAFVVLTRLDISFRRLRFWTHGRPAVWRRGVLFLSVVFLLLFDVLTNVAGAIPGAFPLLIFAVPMFLAYIVCIRVAFAGL